MESIKILTAITLLLSFTMCKAQNSKDKANTQTPAKSELSGIDAVVTHYLHLKNALASDDSKEAAAAGGQLHTALASLGKLTMNEAQKKAYANISMAAEENAEHIAENTGKIEHQREHFQSLSVGIYELVNVFGTPQTLYKDYCPTAKAVWISEFKEIKKNPYMGSSMPNCGSVKDTLGVSSGNEQT